MRIRLLGTGAADGWPNPFCHCPSCTPDAEMRTPTSLVIDDHLMVDCGPEAPRQALRFGVDLAKVRTVLISHSHPDHCAPQFLMHRSWVSDEPLQVVGPEPVIRACRPWLHPDQEVVSFIEVTAADELTLAGYQVRVLPAAHEADGEAVLYHITDPHGVTMLYASDTGELPAGFEDLLGEGPLAGLFLEETFGLTRATSGHHNLALFSETVSRLRHSGHIDGDTQIIAVHMSHYNPPETELASALRAFGARPGTDGQTLNLI